MNKVSKQAKKISLLIMNELHSMRLTYYASHNFYAFSTLVFTAVAYLPRDKCDDS